MPFGRDPLNDERRARFGGLTFDLGEPLVLQGMSKLIWSLRAKDSLPMPTGKRWNGQALTIWSSIRRLGY